MFTEKYFENEISEMSAVEKSSNKTKNKKNMRLFKKTAGKRTSENSTE